MHLSELRIEGFRLFGTGAGALALPLQPGLNVLVGENDAGKTAIIDAVRLALGTTSQEFQRVTDEDFHVENGERVSEFTIRCKFAEVDVQTGGTLMEHLSYEQGKPCLYVTFRATRNESMSLRRRISVDVRSGHDGTGPLLDGNARSFLQATYLKPLRDAERELASGRNSRLSQILQHAKEISAHRGEHFDPVAFVAAVRAKAGAEFPKCVANVSRLADHLIKENEAVCQAGGRLDTQYLANLNLGNESLRSQVSVGGEATPDQRLRSVLEKLDLRLITGSDTAGQLPHGLGYNNLLFMACELLLLGQDEDTLPLLLIEEPEAHLHPQLQLRLVEFLQAQAADAVERPVQVIITTHSPNLASKVRLDNMILVCQGQASPLAKEYTQLSGTDYRFLERFLDVTKANLFFARGVLIVEGDAEALLIPTLARLLGRDFTRYGVSVVNVGNRGLRRWARIFRRRASTDGKSAPAIPVRVACLADRDIMPECAKEALGIRDEEKEKKTTRFESDLPDQAAHDQWVKNRGKDDGEGVRTFVSDHWTLEYDLAHAGLPRTLWRAVALAKAEARLDKVSGEPVAGCLKALIKQADGEWEDLKTKFQDRSDSREYLACKVYEPILSGVSKAMVAQQLASLLDGCRKPDAAAELRKRLPPYVLKAIDYVTGADKGGTSGAMPTAAEDEGAK